MLDEGKGQCALLYAIPCQQQKRINRKGHSQERAQPGTAACWAPCKKKKTVRHPPAPHFTWSKYKFLVLNCDRLCFNQLETPQITGPATELIGVGPGAANVVLAHVSSRAASSRTRCGENSAGKKKELAAANHTRGRRTCDARGPGECKRKGRCQRHGVLMT